LKKAFAVIYMCDSSTDGKELGNETVLRIQEAAKVIFSEKEKKCQWNILLGAGTQPRKLNAPQAKELMGLYIKNLLLENGYEAVYNKPFSPNCISFEKEGAKDIRTYLAEQEAWGTFWETWVILKTCGISLLHERLVVFSSSYHLPRIRYIWSFFYDFKIAECYSCELANPSPYLEWLRYIKVFILGELMFLGFFNQIQKPSHQEE